jgi:hypothetical protein
VASDFVRQISSPFTTRLALVFASWAEENIFVWKPYKTHLLLSFQKIFFLADFEKLSQEVLKVPKAPRSAFRYVWGVQGNGAMAALNHPASLGRRFH